MKFTITPLLLFISILNGHAQVILSEHFDGDVLPPGWTQSTLAADGGWLLGDAHELGSAIFPVLEHGNFIGANDKCYCDHSNDFLKSPTMDLTGYSQIWLLFDYSFLDFAPQEFSLEISTDGGSSWDVLDELSFSAGGYYGWWEKKYYDISAYNSYDEVKIGFRYSDGGDWWSYGASLDDVKIFQPLANDISLDSVTVDGNYAVVGTNMILSGVITNYGENELHSFTAKWESDIGTGTFEITGLNVPQFETYHFTHTSPFIPVDPIQYNVDLSAIDPNGAMDGDISDNSLDIELHGCSSKPDKHVVAELATGTWCAWCVRGHVYMDSMYFLYPQDFIGIAVHNYDPMEVNNYDSAMYAYQNYLNYEGGAAYPSIIAEHKYYMDPMEMPVELLPFMHETVPVGIHVYGEYNDTTGMMDINLRATIVSDLNDIDYRFNLVVKEDSVTGTGPAWDQANAYAGGAYGEMGGYELLPDYVPGALMVYDHVARYLTDGWLGAEGSIPSDVNDLDTFYRNYLIPVDDDWDPEHLLIVGMVIDNSTGKIINAEEVQLKNLITEPVDTSGNDTTIVEGIDDLLKPGINIYPNPADAFCAIKISLPSSVEIELIITDITGEIAGAKNYGKLNGDQLLYINTTMLESGIYLISVRMGDQLINKRLIVSH